MANVANGVQMSGAAAPAAEFKIGIIGGTGLEDPDVMQRTGELNMDTPYGKPSDVLIEGNVEGIPCVLLSRHGRLHHLTPSKVNYRANIWALKKAGVGLIIAANACGSLREELAPGHIVVLDSFIDRTTKREQTFYDDNETEGHPIGVCHLPMYPTFNEKLRQLLIATITELGVPNKPRGTLVCIEGPRFSTRAESEMFRQWGADVVGMTTCPEAVLPRELGMLYASLATITDYDCWKDTVEGVNIDLVAEAMHRNAQTMKTILIAAVKAIGARRAEFIEEENKAKQLAIRSVMPCGSVKQNFDHI